MLETEPLPSAHPLWGIPVVSITLHVAGIGPYLEERRTALFIESCQLFHQGMPLKNVVDKAQCF